MSVKDKARTETENIVASIADRLILDGYGDRVCVQPPNGSGHVGWANRHVDDGPVTGVQRIVVQTEPGLYGIWITIDNMDAHPTHTNLGYALKKPGRTGTPLWRIAEGYVNGYPLHHILYFVLTRLLLKRYTLRRPRRRLGATDTVERGGVSA